MDTHKKVQVFSFLIILIISFVVVGMVFLPFLNILAVAAIFGILFHPLFVRLETRLKSPNISAAITLFAIILMFLVPLYIFGQILFNEIYSVYDSVKSGTLIIHQSDVVAGLPPAVQEVVANISQDLNGIVSKYASGAFQAVTGLLSNVAGFVLSLFLSLFTLFFILRDGAKIKQIFMEISPIAEKQEDVLIDRLVGAVNGVVKGSFLMAIIQGVVAMIGFTIFGVPQPLLWGLFTVMAALVPNVGTSLSLIPAVIYLLVTGHIGAGIGLAVWGMLAVGLIDNLLSPRLIGSRIQLHPLLVLLSVIGGLQFFGFLGFLIGPILLAVFVAMVDIYRSDFKKYLEGK